MLVEVGERTSSAVLKVIGLGGGGGNAVNRMLESEIRGVEFIVANTDIQALNASACSQRLQIGAAITGGLGSGGDPRLGRKAADEDIESIREALAGADMVFITAGMGGGTGTGASSVVAQAAREMGALTVAIVTKPFAFEGRRRMRQAEEGLAELRRCVDTLIVIPNQRLLHVVDKNTPLNEALRVADDVLAHATKGISEIITVAGLINVDFADVRSVMQGMGNALMGMGFGSGDDRARDAAQMAISSPLLEDLSISGAQAILVNFMGGEDMALTEVDEASNEILEAAGEDANVIFGAVIDPNIKDEIRVTLIATGFGNGDAAAVLGEELSCESATTPLSEVGVPSLFAQSGAEGGESAQEPVGVPIGAPSSAATLGGQSFVGTGHLGAPESAAEAVYDLNMDDGVVGTPKPISPRPDVRAAADAAAAGIGVAQPAGAGVPSVSGTGLQRGGGASVGIPDNVVPLVWKKNIQEQGWSPKMSSRWQRVVRRERLDVPRFLRPGRQMD
jgi:cell division protein FtsZ